MDTVYTYVRSIDPESFDYGLIIQSFFGFLALVISFLSIRLAYKARVFTLRDELFKESLKVYDGVIKIVYDIKERLREALKMTEEDNHGNRCNIRKTYIDLEENFRELNSTIELKFIYVNKMLIFAVNGIKDNYKKTKAEVFKIEIANNNEAQMIKVRERIKKDIEQIDELFILIAKLNGNTLIQADLNKIFKY